VREANHLSSDPYEFNFDSGRNIGQHLVQGPSLITSVAPNKVISSKQKLKSASVCQAFVGAIPKIKDTIAMSKSFTTANFATGLTQQSVTAAAAKKRRSSGSAGAYTGTVQSSIGATLVTGTPSILGNVGTLTSVAGQHQFAIAIPSVNISGAALTQISASLVAGGNIKHAKNNVIKDMGFYVTGLPPELLNGQIVNITNSQLAQADIQNTNPNHLQSISHHDDSANIAAKTVQQVSVIANNKTLAHPPKFMDIRTLQLGKGGLITNLPPNAVLLDSSNLQPGTVLQPVSLTSASVTPSPSNTHTHHNRSVSIC